MLRKLAEKGRPCVWIDVADHTSLLAVDRCGQEGKTGSLPSTPRAKMYLSGSIRGRIENSEPSSLTRNVTDLTSFSIVFGEGLIRNIFAFKCIIHICLEAYLQI